ASYIAKTVREAGGFTTEATDRDMIGQIQVVCCPDMEAAKEAVLKEKAALIEYANAAYPSLVARGGGAEDLEVRILNEEATSTYILVLVLVIYVRICYIMASLIINTIVSSLSPFVELFTKRFISFLIISSYAHSCFACYRCVIPDEPL